MQWGLMAHSADKEAANLLAIGWREWAALPGLGIDAIKMKVDTGARTSALHAFSVEPMDDQKLPLLRVGVHPLPGRTDVEVFFETRASDYRNVTDSGGHREPRYVITTDLLLGGQTWPIELTLTNRDTMKFRMLLGRAAMAGRMMVNPARSYLVGKRPAKLPKRPKDSRP